MNETVVSKVNGLHPLFVPLLLVACVLVACMSPSAQPEPMATSMPTASPTPTAAPKPTATPAPPLATPAGALVQPVATAAAIRVDGWSPDGGWLGYWLSAEIPQFFYPFPPGVLHFLNVHTGQTCSYSEYVARNHDDRLIWQADDLVQIVLPSSRLAYRGKPCQGFVSVPCCPETSRSNFAVSPKGAYRASTTVSDEPDGTFSAETKIADIAAGKVKNTIAWKHRGGLGELGLGGQWLTEELFLIHETSDQGPLLITVGKNIVRVAPELLKVSPVLNQGQDNFVILRAAGAVVQGTDSFHLVLFGIGAEAAFPPIRLYHSETGKAEEIPFWHLWTPAYSPDGRWLLMDKRLVKSGYESSALWIRPVDPPGSEAHLLAEGSPFTLWSPDWSKVALGFSGRLTIVRFPSAAQLGSWETGEYSLLPRAWSPKGNALAAEGYIPGSWQQALFVVRP